MNRDFLTLLKPLKLDSSKQNIWFTSDTHFGHQNIIHFCKRPFSSIEEMDITLIENWNNKVSPNDIIFHLGDFAFAPTNRWKELLTILNGKKYLVLGNHDVKRWPGDTIMSQFEDVALKKIIKIDNQLVYLDHYPYLCYAGTYNNIESSVIQLFGHVHSGPRQKIGKDNERLQHLFPYQYDVGVDNNEFSPVSYEEIISKLKQQ